ncbi:MAG: cation:proton antiporter [Lachnospiraceae bacterium]|nr:cation:proton antiporter [Lachnospiraceae bacterium]
MSYHFLLDLALILISTKVLGLVTKKFSLPQVVGALLAGLVLGPAVLNILHETDFILQLSELGVIVLMFTAGLEADVHELKKSGKASFILALFGVLIPLAGGFLVSYLFNRFNLLPVDTSTPQLLQSIFMGVILTATSVSITVETLKELGKLSSRAGNAILGAAIIDDILGIIALTLITSFADSSVNVTVVLAKILGFFVFSGVVGFVCYKLFKNWTAKADKNRRRFVIAAFTLCLLLSFCAEEFFGVADITGAFIAGLIISNTKRKHYIASRFETLSYTLLSPIFFASIGLKVVLPKMTASIVLFAIILSVVAILTKIIGCAFAGKLRGYTRKESLQIGAGMVSRGEVALIVASKGAAVGLMPSALLGPVIVVVVVTTVISPVLLKISFKDKTETENYQESNMVSKSMAA